MNPYQVLNLDPNCDQEDIKKAYRKLIKEHHPDNGGDLNKAKEINEAYDLIGDSEKRKQYDQRDSFESFGMNDFFGQWNPFFTSRTREKPEPQQYEDMHVRYKFSIADLKKGIQDTLFFSRRVECPECKGSGGSGKQVCSDCNGSGSKMIKHQSGNQMFVQQIQCPRCNGYGYKFDNPCHSCKGEGVQVVNEQVQFEIKEVQ